MLDHVTLKFLTGTNGAHVRDRFWWWRPWVLLLFMCMTNNANSTLWPGTLILRRDWYEKKDRRDKEKLEQQRKECVLCGPVFSFQSAEREPEHIQFISLQHKQASTSFAKITDSFLTLYNRSNLDKSTVNLSQKRPDHFLTTQTTVTLKRSTCVLSWNWILRCFWTIWYELPHVAVRCLTQGSAVGHVLLLCTKTKQAKKIISLHF